MQQATGGWQLLLHMILAFSIDPERPTQMLICCPRKFEDEDKADKWKDIPVSGVKSVCQQVISQVSMEANPQYVEQLGATPESIPEAYAYPTRLELKSLELLSRAELIKAQNEDPPVRQAITALKEGEWTTKVTDPELSL